MANSYIEIDNELKTRLKDIGKLWAVSDINPKISDNLLCHWEKLVLNWKDDQSLPLVIRKQAGPRGSEIKHCTGRSLIISDNSFSQWIYYNILKGNQISYDNLKELYTKDEIPFSFASKSNEQGKTIKKKTLGNSSINKLGWKLCHIDPVGLRTKTNIQQISIEELENHFMKLANPKNMFVVPLEIGGLGEIQYFIEAQR